MSTSTDCIARWTQTAEGITVDLANDVTVTFGLEGRRLVGLLSATLQGAPFVVAGQGNLPWFVTPDGCAPHTFLLEKIDEQNGAICIDTKVRGRYAPVAPDFDIKGFPLLARRVGQEVEDRLTIQLAPHAVTVHGDTYRGFAIVYRFQSAERQIHWLYDPVALAPGGTINGAEVIARHLTTGLCRFQEKFSIDGFFSTEEDLFTYTRQPSEFPCIQAPPRGGAGDAFDIVQGQGLAVVTYFARPGALKSVFRTLPGEDFITSADFHYDTLTGEFASQPRYVVALPADTRYHTENVNRWTWWHDYTGALWRDALGIPRATPRPMLALDGTGEGGVHPGCCYPDLLKAWEERLEWVKQQGFGHILLHTPEWISAVNRVTRIIGGNNCCPFEFKLSEHLGGEAGHKQFIDAAHRHGLKVFFWVSGHLAAEAPAFKQHPEWLLQNAVHQPESCGYKVIYSMAMLAGCPEWIFEDLRRVKEATGVDGLWWDSFPTLTLQGINYQSPGREPNAPAVFKLLGRLSQIGYEHIFEGLSQLGISCYTDLEGWNFAGQDDMLYGIASRGSYLERWQRPDSPYTRDACFRALAAGAPLSVWVKEFLGFPTPFPIALPEWFGPLNRAYLQVADRMQVRTLLPAGRGVLWADAAGRPSVLFTYAAQPSPYVTTDLLSGVRQVPGVTLAAGGLFRIEIQEGEKTEC